MHTCKHTIAITRPRLRHQDFYSFGLFNKSKLKSCLWALTYKHSFQNMVPFAIENPFFLQFPGSFIQACKLLNAGIYPLLICYTIYSICPITLIHYCKHTAGHSAPQEYINNSIKAWINEGNKEKYRLPLILISLRISVQVDIGVLSQIMTKYRLVCLFRCRCVFVCVCGICTCTCKLKVHAGAVMYAFAVV